MKKNPQQEPIDRGPLNDYSALPPPVTVNEDIASTLGTPTGEDEFAIEAGGWQGTDDATSTAPSDVGLRASQTPDQENEVLQNLDDTDPTGRAYGGGLDAGDGGIADITGKPVEESRDWEWPSIKKAERE